MSILDRYISRQFASPTGIGGRVITFIMNKQNRPLYNQTIAQLGLLGQERVLDVGCGNGYVMAVLSETHGGVLIGIDPSPSAISAAKTKNRKAVETGKMAFHLGTAEAIALPDAAINIAYTINTVYFWNDLDASFAELFRVLEPGGVFVNALYSRETLDSFSHTAHGYRKYDTASLVDAATRAGFVTEVIPLLNGRALCVRSRKPPQSR